MEQKYKNGWQDGSRGKLNSHVKTYPPKKKKTITKKKPGIWGNYERRYLISETLTDWRLGDDITSEGKQFQSLIYLLKKEYLK